LATENHLPKKKEEQGEGKATGGKAESWAGFPEQRRQSLRRSDYVSEKEKKQPDVKCGEKGGDDYPPRRKYPTGKLPRETS